MTIEAAANAILDVYHRVATGESQGAGGAFYADGETTLSAVTIPVDLLEALAKAAGRKIHGRTSDYRRKCEEEREQFPLREISADSLKIDERPS